MCDLDLARWSSALTALLSVLLSSFFLRSSSFFLLWPFSVKHVADAASAVLCLTSQVVMVQQRSWKLYEDWNEVAHSRSSLPESEKVKQQTELWLEVETVDGVSI